MKHVPNRAQEPDRPQSIEELRRRLNRRLSDFRDGWKRCDNSRCRRWKQCCGEGPDFKCTDDGRPKRTASPEEQAKAISDLYKEVKKRRAEFAAGAAPPDGNAARAPLPSPEVEQRLPRRRPRRRSAHQAAVE